VDEKTLVSALRVSATRKFIHLDKKSRLIGESMQTTQVYLDADLPRKEKALAKLEPMGKSRVGTKRMMSC
jgi:hypothetical protein